MKRVLLLDTSFAARPIHDWLVKEGFETWTIGNRPQDILAMRAPDLYIQDSYSNVSVVQSHVERLKIDYVVPGCTDISIETALQLNLDHFPFDSADTYKMIADKALFRATCEKLDLPSPRRIKPEDLPFKGKLIAKPSDSFSGRGISVFDGEDINAASKALELAKSESRQGEALLETFADGQLYSYSAFLESQRVVDATIVREDGSITPYAVDTSYVETAFPDAGKTVVQSAIERLAHGLMLADGLLHVQFIWDGEKPWLIELGRRCPGDLYPQLVQLGTGKRHAASYASYFVERPRPAAIAQTPRHIVRHTLTAGHHSFEGIWFQQGETMVEFHPLQPAGRTIPPADRIDRVGLAFLEYTDESGRNAAHDRFMTHSSYKTRI